MPTAPAGAHAHSRPATVRATHAQRPACTRSRGRWLLWLQGKQAGHDGRRRFAFGAGDSLLITADVPTVSQITRASAAAPYLSLVLELDPAVIAELAVEGRLRARRHAPVRVEPTDAEVADAALRLMRLLDRPRAVPVLQAQLAARNALLAAGRPARRGDPAAGLAGRPRAARGARGRGAAPDYASRCRSSELAAVAGMSASSFHQHFRAMTSLSPLQFQKQLRLIEARRLMMSEGAHSAAPRFAVGYESVPQFTREIRPHVRLSAGPAYPECTTKCVRRASTADDTRRCCSHDFNDILLMCEVRTERRPKATGRKD